MRNVVPFIVCLFLIGCSTVVSHNYVPQRSGYKSLEYGEFNRVNTNGIIYSEGNAVCYDLVYLEEDFQTSFSYSDYHVSLGYFKKVGEDPFFEYYTYSNIHKPAGRVYEPGFSSPAMALVFNKKTHYFALDLQTNHHSSPAFGLKYHREVKPDLNTVTDVTSITFQGYYDDKIFFNYSDNKESEAEYKSYELNYPEERTITINGCKIEVLDADKDFVDYIVYGGFEK